MTWSSETRLLSIAAAVVLSANIIAIRTADPIDVTAAALVSAYRADDARAAASYRGEDLRVTGTVQRIGSTRSAYAYLIVDDVHCSIDDASMLHAVSLGDAVRLRGRGAGYIFGSPMLEHCELAR